MSKLLQMDPTTFNKFFNGKCSKSWKDTGKGRAGVNNEVLKNIIN